MEMPDRDVGAGQAADEAHRRNVAPEAIQHAHGLLVHRPAVPAEADRTVDHAQRLDLVQRLQQRLDREGAEGLDLDQADLLAGIARLVDRILGGAGHAAQGHDRVVGAVEAVFLDQRREAAAEALRPLLVDFLDHAQRVLHALALPLAVADEGRRPLAARTAGQRVDRHRPQRIERHVPVHVLGAHEGIDVLLVGSSTREVP
jgi:hypothetical protein